MSLQNSVTGANVTYQWQISTDGGTSFSNISGATASTYVANPTVNSSYQCLVSCSAGTPVASTPVAITLSNTGLPTVTGATVCVSGVANLSATGAGTLNWYSATTGGSLLTTGSTYSPSVSSTTTYYVSSTITSTATAGQVCRPPSTMLSFRRQADALEWHTHLKKRRANQKKDGKTENSSTFKHILKDKR